MVKHLKHFQYNGNECLNYIKYNKYFIESRLVGFLRVRIYTLLLYYLINVQF